MSDAKQSDWEYFYRLLGADIHAYLRSMGAGDATASSIVQETFMPARFDGYDPEQKPKPFFKRIARNLFIDRWRRGKKYKALDHELAAPAPTLPHMTLPSSLEYPVQGSDGDRVRWGQWRLVVWIIARARDNNPASFNVWWKTFVEKMEPKKIYRDFGYKNVNGVHAAVSRFERCRGEMVRAALKSETSLEALQKKLRAEPITDSEQAVWELIGKTF